MFQQTNVPGFKKNKTTGFVINTNASDLQAYKKHKQSIIDSKHTRYEVAVLKQQVAEQNKRIEKLLALLLKE